MRLRVTSILVFLAAMAAPAFATNPSLPSDGLEQRVDFWKKIYTQYGADDVVIHDRVYVNLIYDVATDATQNEKTANVKSALREIQSNMDSPEDLSPAAAAIKQAIVAQGLTVTPSLIGDLLDNIHSQLGVKERFRDGVIRSGRYVDQFRQIMTNQGVPTELALLPLVESSFQNVRSKAGAVGVWQFTTGTGRSYLRITSKVDERLDPVRSSEAAARLLRDNYSALGAWPLAITAYNHGRGGMLAAQKEHGSDLSTIIDEYRGPVFGYASMNFYSEFLAAVEIYDNYPQYFGELALERSDSIPQSKPVMAAAKAPAKAAPAATASKYKVRSGDTLYEIAQRFGTSIATLMEKNNLNKPAIYAGQILLVK
ncbi:MAG TPA: transglycosylase SLT domain-containing protein [Terriglobia bacterium]|nr:transglycosylase SLT domain-containing protein [Terriglobia bacterium]